MATLDSSLVGARIAGYEREVTWRQTTSYAAAVGDANPRYLDDSTPGGLVAPPLFAVALTWPVMADIQGQLDAELPAQILPTMVHASEHLVLHRPVRAGERLRVGGQVAAVIPGRAGTRVVLRLEATSGDEPVFTEYAGATFRGVGCDDQGRGAETLPTAPRWDDPAQPVWTAELPVAREAPFVYDACTEIIFPIHTSVSFARAVGLPDVILQGTATLALAARELLDREAGGDPARLREIGCRFTGMVVPGSPIQVELQRREEDGEDVLLGFRVLAAGGAPALSGGFARVRGV
jgi:acyl dehydratase